MPTRAVGRVGDGLDRGLAALAGALLSVAALGAGFLTAAVSRAAREA